MSDRGNLKIVKLAESGRFNPRLCLGRLLEQIEAGELELEKVVIVTVEPRNAEGTPLTVCAAGPGMDVLGAVVGLLELAKLELGLDELRR